ncbi:hypothetical protein Amet_1799 [Alkaliphilus metalliredigens QYMF]|uniref:DUF4367 domain-containing protein n=1 Tax=Alkaliphilus metalliredigens (strain QYMF) TaxID=293826 RepID=A6TP51_ALKMQ|nr:DUF4367 domain-containing protein [Alkaliphilus metalliredigens]ABR47969.1 hypothetical protein Amet_1799 [Alkaliphilus metalliredigens QYMF]
MSKVNELDRVIKEVIHQEVNLIEVPDMYDVWNDIEKNINKKHKHRLFTFNKRIAGIIAALLVLGVTLSTTDEGYTYYRRILNFFSSTEGDHISIQLDYGSNNNPQLNFETTTHKLSLEEAKQNVSFHMGIPSYVPDGYNIQEAFLTEFNGEVLNVELIYISNNNELVRIDQEPIFEQHAEVININLNNATVEQIEKNNIIYTVIKMKNDKVIIIWDMHEVKYTVDMTSNDELMKMVFSIE